MFALPLALAAAALPGGTYVGESGGTAIAAVVDRGGVVAYVCDGKKTGLWLEGRRLGTLGSGRRALTLSAKGKTLRATFAGRTATLRRATSAQGLFRAQTSRGLGGWIVLSKTRQVGVVSTSSSTLSAPKLSTSTLAAGSFVAGQVVTTTAATQLIAVDAAGDGLDISSRVSSTLLGGAAKSLALPRVNSGDAVIVIDTAALKRAGYTLRSATGTVLSGTVPATGGLRVTTPSGVTTTAVSAFHLLRLLADDSGLLNLVAGAGDSIEAREDRRTATGEAQLRLQKLSDKINSDNDKIAELKAEANERYDAAMEAATTELTLGVVSGAVSSLSAISTGTTTQSSTVTVTIRFPPPPRTITIRLLSYVAD